MFLFFAVEEPAIYAISGRKYRKIKAPVYGRSFGTKAVNRLIDQNYYAGEYRQKVAIR